MILKHNKANVIMAVVMMSIFLTCFCGQVLADTWEGPFKYTVTGSEARINAYYASNSDEGIDLIIPHVLGGFPVTSIAEETFLLRKGTIRSISIPISVRELGSFSGLPALEKINIPDSVTQLNELCFLGCSSLSTIEIPASVESIGEGAFLGCTALWGVFGGNGITSIGDRAFFGCSSLRFFKIPEGVTTIGDETFAGCTSMRSITIPERITSIGKDAFLGSGLNTITFESPETEIYDSEDTIPRATKIIGNRFSNAEKYAKKYDRAFQDINEVNDEGITTQDIMKTAIVLLVLACFVLVLIIARISRQNKQLLKTIEDSGSAVEKANLPG